MASDRVQWGKREGDGPLGNYERVKIAELIEDYIATTNVSTEVFGWWSDVESKLLQEVGEDD